MSDNFNEKIWKWWVFILVGLLIGAFSIWQAWDTQNIRALKGVFLAVLCIVVGLWSKSQSSSVER